MASSDSRQDSGRRFRPCDVEKRVLPQKNVFGERLGPLLHQVFCDLHDAEQVSSLSTTTGLSPADLMKRLYVRDRYGANDPDYPMDSFYGEYFESSRPHGLAPDTRSWGSDDSRAVESLELEMDADDRDLATMLLAGDDLRPRILVGRVGSGKTTYVRRFFEYVAPHYSGLKDLVFLYFDVAPNVLAARYHGAPGPDLGFDAVMDFCLTRYFNVHLRGLPPLADVFRHIYETESIERTIETYPEDERQMRRNEWYRRMRSDLTEFNHGRVTYLQHSLGRKVVICLDNADQWSIPDQKELIKTAQYKQGWYGASLMIVVRQHSLSDLARHVSFSQYRPIIKLLTPPKTHLALAKRLEFLTGVLGDKERGPYIMEGAALGASVVFRPENLIEFLQLVQSSFGVEETSEFVRAFTNENLRRVMDFAEVFLSSRVTDVWRFFPDLFKPPEGWKDVAFWDSGHASVHAVIRVAALAYGPHYHPDESFLCNLFSNGSATEPYDCLIRYRILALLHQRDGTTLQMVSDGFSRIGYGQAQIHDAVKALHEAGLIESKDRLTDPNAVLFTTLAGSYYLDELVTHPEYLQHMRDGCFLPGRKKVVGLTGSTDERIWHTAEFVAFLDGEEQTECSKGLDMAPGIYRRFCGDGLSIPRIARSVRERIRRIRARDTALRSRTLELLDKVANRGTR